MKKKAFSFRDRAQSFRYAFAGIGQLIRREHNAWIHCTVAVCVVIAGFLFHLSAGEWIAIVIVSGAVLAAEALNSSIELLADHLSPAYSEAIKHVKDMAAGAVLLLAIAAAVTGLIIFIPKIAGLF